MPGQPWSLDGTCLQFSLTAAARPTDLLIPLQPQRVRVAPHTLRIDCKPNKVQRKTLKDKVSLLCFVFILVLEVLIRNDIMNKRDSLADMH